eukprot:SAG11_NODE_1882_length_4128_cov_2.284438_3_plen_112_part_00
MSQLQSDISRSWIRALHLAFSTCGLRSSAFSLVRSVRGRLLSLPPACALHVDFRISKLCEDYKGLRELAIAPQAVMQGSAKLQMLQPLLQKLQVEGHRTLVFSQWTSMLDL